MPRRVALRNPYQSRDGWGGVVACVRTAVKQMEALLDSPSFSLYFLLLAARHARLDVPCCLPALWRAHLDLSAKPQAATIPYHTVPYRSIPYHTILVLTIPFHTIL